MEPLNLEEHNQNIKEKLEKTFENLKKNFNTIRSARASTSILEHIYIDYYGQNTPLNQVASFNIPEPRMIIIQPYDKSKLSDIEKAISSSNIGINPQNDGNAIRLVIPELSAERRLDLVKQAKDYLEQAKVSLRNIRRDANDLLKKHSEISEDTIHDEQGKIQQAIDLYTKKCEESFKVKEDNITNI